MKLILLVGLDLNFDFAAKEALFLKDDINKIAKIPKKGPVIKTKEEFQLSWRNFVN